MNVWDIVGQLFFICMFLFFFMFAIVSFLENEKKAAVICVCVVCFMAALNISLFFFPQTLRIWIFGGVFVVSAVVTLYLFLPPRPKQSLQIIGPGEKIDERDVIFARFDLRENSPHYNDYYHRHQTRKSKDDEIRQLPDILSPFHVKKKPEHFNLAAAEFEFLEHQLHSVDGAVQTVKSVRSPQENTEMIKDIMAYLGAGICGVCELDQSFVYSHVGRGPEEYGSEIRLEHKYAVIFALEMDHEMIAAAPKSPVIIETANKYVEAARISIIAADHVRRMGYSARAHIAGSNYQAILPPLGWKAGLGELGRFGMLITWKYGARMRLGMFTTELPLLPAQPIAFGVQDFCDRCKKCAINCPSQAISFSGKTESNGVMKWVIDRENCYRFWRKVGTDCAVCISVCPYSKPDTLIHKIIRHATTWSKRAQSLAIWGDDLFYGRKPKNKMGPF